MSLEIRRIEKEKMEIIIPLLRELNPKIPKEVLQDRLQGMLGQNYVCVGVFDDGNLVGISGLWVLVKYYVGKHVEPDNVYITPQYRGKGVGKMLMKWIFAYAKSVGCVASELNCYVHNKEGQEFWKSMGYQLVAYHYQKQL